MPTSAGRRRTTRLRKELGLFDVYAISTGAMFSSGFFLLPGLAAAQTGTSVPLAYLVASIFILPAMFSVAELATAMPRAGGAYYFLDRSMGPLVGTIGGLGTWMALVLKSAFALIGMGAYLALYVDVPIQPLAIVLTLVFMAVNIVGAKETSGLQRMLVTALLVIMGVFIVVGLLALAPGGSAASGRPSVLALSQGLTGFMATVGLVFVSYAGLTKVASVSEEIRDPERNIPLGMGLSLASAALVYSLGVYVIIAVVPLDTLVTDLTPVATAADGLFDWMPAGTGVALIVVAAVAAFASTGNAGLLAASRYPLAMARDRLVPARFSALGRFRTPVLSIVATSLVMILALVLLDVAGLAKLASAFQLLLFSLLNLAVVIMRESAIEGYDPGYRSPLYPWIQIFGFVAPLWLIAEMGHMAILFTMGLVALTISWFFLYARAQVDRTGAIFHTFARWGARRHSGLDLELRDIVREKGLRLEDPFDEVVARALLLDVDGPTDFGTVTRDAAVALAVRSGASADVLEAGFLAGLHAGFVPIGHGAALPHVRVPGLARPLMLLARCREGICVSSSIPLTPEQLEGLRAVFFLASAEEEPTQHLRLMGHLATLVEDPDFVSRWLQAPDEASLKATLMREERWLMLRVGTGPGAVNWHGMRIRSLHLPDSSLVAVVERRGRSIVPNGDTELITGDSLTIVGDPQAIRLLTAQA